MKFNDAYPALTGGVSQKPPGLRRLDQMWDQVNLLSDPVRGLVRRQGSVQLSRTVLGPVAVADTLADAENFESIDLRIGSQDVAVAYRKEAKVGSSTLPVAIAYDKTTGTQYTLTRPVTDAALDLLVAGGVSAAVALGRFIVFAGNTMTPQYTRTEQWTPASNQKLHTVWVRGGAYSRTFAFALIRGNQKFWVAYQTRSASYPDVLDTSDLFATDPDYSKKVQDRTNEYNSRALKWAGDALKDATPENIADKLAAQLRVSGFLSASGSVTVKGSTLCITDDSVEEVETNDGGDQSLMRATGNTVPSPDYLTTTAYPGKVVKVRPTNDLNDVVFYLEAVSKDKSTGDYTAVSWEEAAGVRFDVTRAFAVGTVVGSNFYLSTDLAWLAAQTGLTVPGYQPSICGDADPTQAILPDFLKDGKITSLGMFQDRLVIGAGAKINSSVTGDYFNFFPNSMLTELASDPVNFGIVGGEDDTQRRQLIYDRSLILVGDKRLYVVDGRTPFTPSTAAAPVFAHITSTGQVQPVAAGNFIFFAKNEGGSVSVQQLQHGQVAEQPFVQELTFDLDSYIAGAAKAMVANSTPDVVILRAAAQNGLYVYQYKDQGSQRVHSAWNRWDLATPPGGGAIVSLHAADEAVLVARVMKTLRLNPGDVIDEQLTSLSAYSTLFGPGTTYSIQADATYGTVLDAIAYTGPGTTDTIGRSLPAVTPTLVKAKFKIGSINADDAIMLRLFDQSNAEVLSFIPVRESTFDSSRRAKLAVRGNAQYMTSGVLATGVWYEFQVACPDPTIGAWTATITRLSDSTVVGSASGTDAGFLNTMGQLWFTADGSAGLLTCPTQYADVWIQKEPFYEDVASLTVEKINLTGDVGDKPYLDLMKPVASISSDDDDLLTPTGSYAAHGPAGDYHGNARGVGTEAGQYVGLLMTGYFVPTNPNMPSQKGAGIIGGELVISDLRALLADTGGICYDFRSKDGSQFVMAYAGAAGAYPSPYTPEVGVHAGTQPLPPLSIPLGSPGVAGPEPGSYYAPPTWGSVPAPDTGTSSSDEPFDIDDYMAADQNPASVQVTKTAPRKKARLTIPVAAAASDYTLTIASYLWTPLNVVGLEYDGQWFFMNRRIGG